MLVPSRYGEVSLYVGTESCKTGEVSIKSGNEPERRVIMRALVPNPARPVRHHIYSGNEGVKSELSRKEENEKGDLKMIKRVRLDYKPVAKRTSEEAAFVVSAEHVAAVNRSIEKKVERNKRERRESEKEAGKYIVR